MSSSSEHPRAGMSCLDFQLRKDVHLDATLMQTRNLDVPSEYAGPGTQDIEENSKIHIHFYKTMN
jgi:hypothetical protein